MTNEQGLAGVSAIIQALIEEAYTRGVKAGYEFRKMEEAAEGAEPDQAAPSSAR